MRSRSKIVRYLEREYPDQKWKAIQSGFGWTYESDAGWTAWRVAILSPRYDGDDDSFTSAIHVWKKDGSFDRGFPDFGLSIF